MASLSRFMEHLQQFTWSAAAFYVVVAIPAFLLLNSLFSKHSLRHIPVVGGPSLPLLSYLGAYKFVQSGKEIFQEGYEKYKGRVFKIAMFDQWLVVVNGTQLVDEIQRAPDDKISFVDGVGELIGIKYIFGHELHDSPYHINLISTKLTRNIGPSFGLVYDEIDKCFQEMVPATEKEWMPVSTILAFRHMIARVSSRVFVGEPLCHNLKYLDASTRFTMGVDRTRLTLNRFPVFLKPLVANRVSEIDECVREGLECIGPTIEERIKLANEYGKDWEDKPNDMLQWIIDEALSRGQTAWSMVKVLFLVNFAAIFTTSNALTHALNHLAAAPELMAPLREEVDRVIAEEGWTKAAMNKMYKLDSFLRESQRCNGINITSLLRQTAQDFTLSDGTFLPKGTLLVTPALASHLDSANYKDPEVFNPWRFVEMNGGGGGENSKYQYVTTSADYVAFGHGKHACPGRFFAVNELKAFMAYIILNYDVKFEDGKLPERSFVFMSVLPNKKAQVLFKKRTAQA